MQRNLNQGFTLIELIIVITIIAILAAVALPRFVDIQKDARIAKVNSVFGTIRSAMALAKGRCELDISGNVAGTYICNATGGYVNMDGTAVTMVNKYPTADNAGIIVAAQINASADGMTLGGGGNAAGSELTLSIVGAPNPATCRISYAGAIAGSAPVVSVLTAGC